MTRARAMATVFVAVGAALATFGIGDSSRSTVEAAPESERVLLISDSVGLGTRGILPDAFPAHWDVNIIGKPAAFVESLLDDHFRVAQQLTPGIIGDHVIVAGGYNYPFWDPERFDRSIDDMVNALTAAGVEHVYWVTLREVKPEYITASAWRQVQPYYWYFPRVNQHLRDALWRHPNLTLVDWAANADQPGLTYDAIHLNQTGATLYSQLIARAVELASTQLVDGQTIEIDVTDDPAASAVMVNLAAVFPRRMGFVTASPCDEPLPNASQLVYRRDDVVAAGSIIPVDDQGRICAFVLSGTNLIADVSGTFTSSAGVVDAPPNRIFDSRIDPGRRLTPGTYEVTVTDGVDPVTDPVALTVGAVFPNRPGYVAAHPCDQQHETVTVNLLQPDRSLTNMVIVEPDAQGRICMTIEQATMDLVVDRTATFASDPGDAAAAVQVATPTRLVDTRDWTSRPVADQIIRFSLADTEFVTAAEPPVPTVEAVGFNLGIIAPDRPGFATVWPCAEARPNTSNINFFGGEIISNFVVGIADDDGEVCVSATTGTHLTIDVLAGFGDGFDATLPTRALDTRLSG